MGLMYELKASMIDIVKESPAEDDVSNEVWLDSSVYNRNVVAVMRNSKMCAAADHGFICSQCWVPLDDRFNCSIDENKVEGKCFSCINGRPVSPEVKEFVLFELEKNCVKCSVLLNETNCTKSQYRRTKSRCMSCTDYASANKKPMSPKIVNQELEMKKKFENLGFTFGIMSMDFECIRGQWQKVTQCGVTYYDHLCANDWKHENCGSILVENFVIVDNIDIDCDDLPFDEFLFGQTRYVTLDSFREYLKFRICYAESVIVFDSNLEVKILNLWKIDTSKILDLQLVVGIDVKRKMSLTDLLLKFNYEPRNMHCAGNDSYWIFVVYCRAVFDFGYVDSSSNYRKMMFDWLSSRGDFDEFVRFQVQIQTCSHCSTNENDFMTIFRRLFQTNDFDFDPLILYVRAYLWPVKPPILSVKDVGGVT